MANYFKVKDGKITNIPAKEPLRELDSPFPGRKMDADGEVVWLGPTEAPVGSGGGDNSAVLSAIGGLGLKVSAQQAAIKDISDRLKAAGI